MLRIATSVTALILCACSLGAGETLALNAAVPQRQDLHRWIQVPATMRANQEVVLHARIAGYLTAITVDRGSQVTLGQHIATVSAPEMDADRTRLQAELEVAKATYARLVAAQKKSPDLIVPRDIDEADGRVRIATASLQRCESLIGFGAVMAPFAGVITARWADPGAYIPVPTGAGTGGALVTVTDLATVRVMVPVPEKESAVVTIGTPATVQIDALTRTMTAAVSRHAHAIDSATGTLTTEIDLPNADLKLMPGMFARVRLAVETHAQVLSVPTTAVVAEGATNVVFVVVANQAHKTVVKTGFTDGARTEIISGLGEADVVAQVATGLADGKAVTVAAKP